MAFDMFLKIDGVEGESTADRHRDEIEVDAWRLGMEQVGTSVGGGGGGGAGKVVFKTLVIEKRADVATPELMLACAKGTHIKEAELTVLKAGATPFEVLVVTLKDVIVAGVQHATNEERTRVGETLTLGYMKIELAYRHQKPDGSADAPREFKWNVKANKQM